MMCLECKTKMLIRKGSFGDFYYCPNQSKCKQPTISKSLDFGNSTRDEIDHTRKQLINSEVEMFGYRLEARKNEIIDPRMPFDPDVDDPFYDDDDGYCGAF